MSQPTQASPRGLSTGPKPLSSYAAVKCHRKMQEDLDPANKSRDDDGVRDDD